MANKKEFIQYYLKAGKTHSWDELAKMFNFVSGEALRSFVKRNRRSFSNRESILNSNVLPDLTTPQTTSNRFVVTYFDKDQLLIPVLTEQDTNRETGETTLTYQSTKPLSPSEIDDLAQVDNITRVVTRTWLKSNKNGIWTYSICTKLIEQPKEDKTDYKKEFEDFLNERVKGSGIAKANKPIGFKADQNALILSLSDLHLDKKTYEEETGEEGGIDTQINRAYSAAIDIIDRAAASHKIEVIYIIGGNDFYHANNAANTTKKGTPLDVDGRWNDSFKKGLNLIVEILDYAKQIAPVEFITVLGNHSPEREYYLSVALEAYYRNESEVTVETVNNVRKYFRYGNSTFMLSHEFGNKAKDLPIIFALENARDFSECKYKFILSGHVHSKKELMYAGTSEQYGILHKTMPSMSSTDAWHHENLYIGNQKSCIGLVINSQFGEIAELIYNE